MSSPAGVRRPICVLCRHLPHSPTTNSITTSASRWAPQLLGALAFTRPVSTHVYIPQRYGQNVGKTPEKEVEDRYFVKLMRSQEEPPVVTAEHPGSSKATLDFRMGRFYDIEPVEAISDILAHHFPEDYFWPNPRTPPEVESRKTWRDIDWFGWGAPALPRDRKGNKLQLEYLREGVENGMAVNTMYFGQIDITKNNALKYMLLVEAFRVYIKQQSWDRFKELLDLLNMDSNIRPYMRRGMHNQILKELAIHGRTKPAPREVVESLTVSFHRPFTNEALLFLLDHVKRTATILRLFREDHGILPHISVSNKAFLKEMETLENRRKWRKKGNEPRTDPAYYIARRKLYRQFTKHFDADRVNAESIRLLLKYAVDRDEVKRVWNIVIQAAIRDPTILRKNQHLYLGALRRFPIQFEDIGNDKQGLEFPSMVHQNAENLAELCGVLHTLKEHGQQPNRETLVALITVSAMYGSSTTLNMLLPKLMNSHRTPTPPELRNILRMVPQEFSTDLITQRYRLQGNPRVWIQYQQKLVLSNYLRQFVGNSEACLVEYVRALGRCGATHEVWEEWSRLRERGFRLVDGGKVAKDGTLVAFVTTLGVAGDAILVKRCFAELKAFKKKPIFQTPMFLMGLLACRPTSFNPNLGQEYSYPLSEAVEGMIGESKVLEKVQRRMRSGRLNLHWSPLEKRMARIVFREADRLVRCVKNREDLTWAENAVMQLLEKVSRDGSVPGGSVSTAIKCRETQTKDVRL